MIALEAFDALTDEEPEEHNLGARLEKPGDVGDRVIQVKNTIIGT